jgi:peptidoglycan-N-acetylglucosamine deacetylase
MGIEGIESQVVYPRRSARRINRTSLVVTLCAILGLLGSLMLTMTENLSSIKLNNASITTDTTGTSGQTTLTSAAASALPKSSLVNAQSPIVPFPTLLWQQIAVLQAHNRFLYTGNRYLPEIALTFDDGPNPYYTPQVLAILKQFGIKATFFCVGRQVARYPDLVKQEYADGNLVGNHSWSHPNLALLSGSEIVSQINLTSDAIQQAIGVRPTFFRPPYGVINARVLAEANLLSLTTIIWNDEALDWTTPGTDVIVSRILNLAADGAIILLHDGGGDRSQTIAALPTIITSLQARGFQFVTLQQMLKDMPDLPASTQTPVSEPTTVSPTP